MSERTYLPGVYPGSLNLCSPLSFTGGLNNGLDFMSMPGAMGPGSLGGLDFASMLRNYFGSNYTPASSSTETTKMTPAQREKKIEELDKKSEEAEKAVTTEQTKLEEKEDAKKAVTEENNYSVITSIGRGIKGFFTNMLCEKDSKGKNRLSPKKIAIGAGLITLSVLFPVAGTALAVAGAAASGYQIAKGASRLIDAKTGAEKGLAIEEMTEGAVGAAFTFAGVKVARSVRAAKAAKDARAAESAMEGLNTAAKNAATKNAIVERIPMNAIENGREVYTLRTVRSATPANVEIAAQDAELLAALKTQIGILRDSKGSARAIKNANNTIRALLQQTTKDGGISPEMELALTKIKTDSPEIGGCLKARHKASGAPKTVNDLGGRETNILASLRRIQPKTDADKTLISEAIELLSNMNKSGADRAKLITTLQELQKSESLGGVLKVNLADAESSLAPSLVDGAKARISGAVDSTIALPGRAFRGTARVLAQPFNKTKVFGRNVINTLNPFSQQGSLDNNSITTGLMEARFAQADKAVTEQKDAVAKAQNKQREAVEALAKLHKVELKDDHGLKSVEKLQSEIMAAREEEKTAKEALAAAQKEKGEKTTQAAA